MPHCKISDVSHVYQGSGFNLPPLGFVYFTAKQVLRLVVSPTLQILKTGSVDSWLPSLAHFKPIQPSSSLLSNAQESFVQVRSKRPMHYSRPANGRLGLASLISCYIPCFITGRLYTKTEVTLAWPKSRPHICLQSDGQKREANICLFQLAGHAGHLRPGGSAADAHHELGPARRNHHHLL